MSHFAKGMSSVSNSLCSECGRRVGGHYWMTTREYDNQAEDWCKSEAGEIFWTFQPGEPAEPDDPCDIEHMLDISS